MKRNFKIVSVILAALMLTCSFAFVVSAETSTAIGYKLVANNTGDGYITAEIYVTNGVALVGQVGVSYDNEKVTLVNYDKTSIETKVLTNVVESVIGELDAVDTENTDTITEDSSVIITSETNSAENLIRDDSIYFAWFANYTSTVDASEADVKIAEIRFAVKENATGLDEAITLCTSAPETSTGIVGYKSGMYISKLENSKAISFYADKNPMLSYSVSYVRGDEFVVVEEVLTEYNGEGGEVSIPANVTSIGTGVFTETTTSILLPNGVTQVSEGAFASGTKVYISPNVSVDLISSLKTQNYSVILYGDVNNDGAVNVDDMKLFIKSTAGNATEITSDTNVKDTSFDNKVSLKDIRALVKYLAGALVDLGYQG